MRHIYVTNPFSKQVTINKMKINAKKSKDIGIYTAEKKTLVNSLKKRGYIVRLIEVVSEKKETKKIEAKAPAGNAEKPLKKAEVSGSEKDDKKSNDSQVKKQVELKDNDSKAKDTNTEQKPAENLEIQGENNNDVETKDDNTSSNQA